MRILVFLPLLFHLRKAQSLVDQDLAKASLQGDLETIKEIINNHKLTKDAEKNPKIHWDDAVTTPLHLAAGNGHLDIVKFYQETLEEDISSFKVTNDTTPLHCALHNHRINVLEFYLDYYQEKIFFLNVLNEKEPSSTKIMYELDLQLPGDLFLKLLKEFDLTGHYFLQIRKEFNDFYIFTEAIAAATTKCTGLSGMSKILLPPGFNFKTCNPSSDKSRFQLEFTTTSLPFQLPRYIHDALIERTSNDAEYHWHLDVTDMDGGNLDAAYYDYGQRVEWFQNGILLEKKVKVTEFENGAQFDWTVGKARIVIRNGIRHSSELQIKLRIVVDNEPKMYFSKLIRKPPFENGFIKTEFPCFKVIQTTVL